MRAVLDTNVIVSATLIRGGNEDETLAQEGVLVPGTASVKASRDPEDDKFLAAAVRARARYVVTGDKDLLDLKVHRGVRMVKPAQFLRAIVARERRER